MIYNRLIVAAIGFIRLEPYDGKLSRTVLRGGKDSNALLLPDYASVEMLHHPEFAGMPLAVGGNPEARHGIVLTANYIAKQKGVKPEWHYGRRNRFARKLFLYHQGWICICDFHKWQEKSIQSIQTKLSHMELMKPGWMYQTVEI